MALEGVVLIDKPKGPTSFDLVRKIRCLTGVKRVGHAGTLDPEASGLLVLCLGAYTKLCGYLTNSAKVYEAVIALGIATSSDDAEGDILDTVATDHLSLAQITQVCRKFVGTISQVPPKYSAIKIKGQRAYKMARAQQEFVIAPRDVQIFSLDLAQVALPRISVRVHCSKGTYIRALARDIGEQLQVGGHARDIRRVASGAFDISQAVKFEELTLEGLRSACLTGRAALGGLENFQLSLTDAEHIRRGRPISLNPGLQSDLAIAMFEDQPVAVMGNKGQGWSILRVI